jgi:hypothetical protein
MSTPSNIQFYVKLIVSKELDKSSAKEWFACVRDLGPNGVLSTIQTPDDKGTLRSVSMVCRAVGEKFEYIVPLTRDLIEREVEPIIQCFVAEHPEVDFDVETSVAVIRGFEDSAKIKDSKYVELCTLWAKQRHDEWYKDRTDNGWSYGTSVSLKDKKHPLLRPWHELSDQHRKIDLDQPKQMMKMLADSGYAVLDKDEFDSMVRLLKGGL